MARRYGTARWLTMVVVVILTAAACTFGEESGGGDGDGGGNAGQGEAVTLTMWAHRSKSFNAAIRSSMRAYETEHPNVTLELETFDYDTYIQTLQTALPAGNAPDIIHMFGTWTCSYADFLATVPDDVTTLADAQTSFFPGPLGGFTCGDALYGLPEESNVEYGASLVNTAMADDAGVTTDGWATWDEFIADAKKMTVTEDGAITRAGYHFTAGDGLAHSFLSLIIQGGGSYLNADGTAFTLNAPEGERSLTLLKSMVDQGIIDPVVYNDENNWVGDCYFTELCAMGLVGPWAVADYKDDYPEVAANTIYLELPPLEDSKEFIADSGWGISVPTDSSNADIAWDFAKFAALDAENAASWNLASGTLPALVGNGEGHVEGGAASDERRPGAGGDEPLGASPPQRGLPPARGLAGDLTLDFAHLGGL